MLELMLLLLLLLLLRARPPPTKTMVGWVHRCKDHLTSKRKGMAPWIVVIITITTTSKTVNAIVEHVLKLVCTGSKVGNVEYSWTQREHGK